ncbi:cyclic nucleotide-binding/CBS domain-containing protein [Candidatus Omnitrophota bacterium]
MKKQRAFSMHLSRGLVVATENATVVELARLMDENNIGAVLIIKSERLVGIASERDIIKRVIAKGLPLEKTKAKDFMTTEVVAAEFNDGVEKIYQKLCEVKFRHLPIVDKGKVVGIASQKDVLYNLTLKES